MRLTRRVFSRGLTATLAAPAVIGRASAQGATLKIGMVLPVTGPAAEQGRYALTGAKIAVDAVNKAGGVLGKPIELVIEDDQTTNPGIVLAFSKLAAQSDIVAFLGSIRSTQVHAMAPDVLKLGKPVMIGGTDPALDPYGQSMAVSLPAERFLFGQRDRRFRRQHARQEEMGDRAFDRRLRHGRRQGADRGARQGRRDRRARPGLRQSEPGFHAGRARRQAIGRRDHRAPISPSRTISASSRASCASSASRSPMSARRRSSTSPR